MILTKGKKCERHVTHITYTFPPVYIVLRGERVLFECLDKLNPPDDVQARFFTAGVPQVTSLVVRSAFVGSNVCAG